MLSRVSRLGARLLREARVETRAGNLIGSRDSLYQGHANRYSTPLVTPTVQSLRNILFSTATSGDQDGNSPEEKISVTFVNKDGSEKTISVPVGMSILEAAHENDIELEGACEGSLACSTCHVIVMPTPTSLGQKAMLLLLLLLKTQQMKKMICLILHLGSQKHHVLAAK